MTHRQGPVLHHARLKLHLWSQSTGHQPRRQTGHSSEYNEGVQADDGEVLK